MTIRNKKLFLSAVGIVGLVVATLILLPLAVNASSVVPMNGMPNSSRFGYGMYVDPWGEHIEASLNVSAGMRLDWVATNFDWAAVWPDVSQPPDMRTLDHFMSLTAQHEIPVMMSIEHAPSWAMTAAGPDPILSAALVTQLRNRYPSLRAVELYSGANTADGWGHPANPSAYAQLFHYVRTEVDKNTPDLELIAAGLVPVETDASIGNMSDLEFLDGLYQAGLGPYMPIIGLKMPVISQELLQLSYPDNPYVFRNYEVVRNHMLMNNHSQGLIWITGFSWPEGMSGVEYLQDQGVWLQEAFQLASSQLYVGAAFFVSLNPTGNGGENSSLIWGDMYIHPGLERLSNLVALQNGGTFNVFSGSPLTKRMRSNYKLSKLIVN